MIIIFVAMIAAVSPLLGQAGSLPLKGREEKVTEGAKEIFVDKLPGLGRKLQEAYKATDGSYFLAIPEKYDAKKSYPLVLAVCPFPKGEFMYLTWTEAIAKHRFIFVCPNNAGNDVPFAERGQRVFDVLEDVQRKFKIDKDRIFVTGFSGGSYMATAMVKALPDVFAGHIPIGGPCLTSDASEFRSLRTRLGFFLFAGEKDVHRPDIEMAKRVLDEAKQPCELLIGEGKGHSPPSPKQGQIIYEWFLNREKLMTPSGKGAPSKG